MGQKAGKIALGLGLLTGAITGLLFAPEEGKKIRQKIAKGDTQGLLGDLESVGEEIKQMIVDLGNRPSIKEAMEKAKDKAADVASIKRDELDHLLRKASTTADQFKKKLSDYVNEQKNALEEHLGQKAVKKSKPAKKAKKAVAKKAPAKAAPAKKAPAKKAKKVTKKKK